MIYLTKDDLIKINQLVISRAGTRTQGVQYFQGLDVIIEQPKQVVFGRELYPNVWIKAAFIIQKITKKHLFADGNKRTALLAGLTFLKANQINLRFSTTEGQALILSVTNSPDSDAIMVTLAEWLKDHQLSV